MLGFPLMTVFGKCLCGAVKVTAAAPPIAARTRWCWHCQFIAAGNSTVNARFYKKDAPSPGR